MDLVHLQQVQQQLFQQARALQPQHLPTVEELYQQAQRDMPQFW
jgi:hypothetical protein